MENFSGYQNTGKPDAIEARMIDRSGLAELLKDGMTRAGIKRVDFPLANNYYQSLFAPDTPSGEKVYFRPTKQYLHYLTALFGFSGEDTIKAFRLAGHIYTEDDVLADAGSLRGERVNSNVELEDFVGGLVRNFKDTHPEANFGDIYEHLWENSSREDLSPTEHQRLRTEIDKMGLHGA